MVAAWWLLPAPLISLFFDVHQRWAFPATLAVWLLSDAIATNVFAADRAHMAAALSDPPTLLRMLHAKDLVLWTIVVPPSLLAGLLVGAFGGPTVRDAVGGFIIVAMPFATLGIASWLGALFPYHPIPLRTRWSRRRELRWRNLRWLLLSSIPYAIVTPLTALAIAPALGLWYVSGGQRLTHNPPPGWAFHLGAASILLIAFAMWLGGNRMTMRIVARRQVILARYLADPDLG